MADSTRRVLRVFLASPSDLVPERKASREAQDDANRMLASVGWAVEVLGWEDRLPGSGRPQEQINQDVDICDLFVGVLWRRWGMPTGEFESGFEEEVHRARDRNRDTGEPELWIYFKKVEPEQADDPGNQLRRVLDFRRQLVEERELMFSEFETPEEWRKIFTEALVRHVLNIHSKTPPTEVISSQGSVLTPAADRASAEATEQPSRPVPEQLRKLLADVAGFAEKGEDAFQRDVVDLSPLDRARFYLLAASWMSELGTGEMLNVHAANLIYRFREEINPTRWEHELLVSTMVREGNRYIPGWFWIRSATGEATGGVFRRFAVSGPTDNNRVAFLNLLARAPGFDSEKIADEEIATLLAEDSEEVIVAALGYAAVFAGQSIVDAASELITPYGTPRVTAAAETTIVSILAREDPELALKRILDMSTVDGKSLDILKGVSARLSNKTLEEALSHSDTPIRSITAAELARRDALGESRARELLSDASASVRAAAVKCLIAIGVPPSTSEIRKMFEVPKPTILSMGSTDYVDANNLIEELFAKASFEDLKGQVRWFSLDGPLAYQALATRHWEKWHEQLREDLSEGFERLEQEDATEMQTKFGEEQAEILLNSLSDQTKLYTRERYAEAALAGLALHGDGSDAELARAHLTSNPDTCLQAVRVLAKHGEATDADQLLSVAKDAYGELAVEAARAAIFLTPGRWEIVSGFLADGNAELLRAAIESIEAGLVEINWETLETFLYSENASVRVEISRVFIEAKERADLLALITRYSNTRGTHYYDVIAALDRELYAPRDDKHRDG